MYRSSRFLLLNRESLRRSLQPNHLNSRQLFTIPSSRDKEAAANSSYVNETYESWRNDPNSVHKAWNDYFKASSGQSQQLSVTPDVTQLIQLLQQQLHSNHAGPYSSMVSHSPKDQLINDHLKVHALIRSYQTKGHKISNLDPLGFGRPSHENDDNFQDLSLDFFNFTEADLSRQFKLPSMTYICGGSNETLSLEEILNRLKKIYTRSIGVEYMHINDPEKRNWIRQQFEWPGAGDLSAEEKKRTLKRLIRATKFEEFLAKKWSAEKRFGLEGCDMLIPAMKTVIDTVSARGVDTIIMGMPHRGRLNVLANVTRKPLEEIFNEFDSKLGAGEEGSGDVKYHLGTATERINRVTNAKVKMVVVANPSHLEAVDPVVVGKARSEQFYRDDKKGDKVMGMMIHGDAAFSGQGVVFETFHLSDLPAYTTHGTVHIVVNNQIGFTTSPRFSRSSPYCTDVARVVYAPIFHVNADDPEAVIHVCRVAAEWRSKFKKDVVIDLVSYRKNGHNEVDEPKFTNPFMYKAIEKLVPLKKKYAKALIDNNVVQKDWYEAELKKYETILEEAYNNSKNDTYSKEKHWIDSPWKKFFKGNEPMVYPDTGISEETLKNISDKFAEIPSEEGFEIHKSLKRVLNNRSKYASQRTADWAMGEAFAFGSLLIEGTHVRLSGQDVERGTFSHRHHVLHNQAKHLHTKIPLNELWSNQAHYTVCNSSLSEYAVLGFELGYSLTNPNALVMWEAQFGDFANGAQIIIDQFLASGQTKWTRQTGLVLLLPHGYDGMGPEHSSARLERYLQLIDEDHGEMPSGDNIAMKQLQKINMIVANPTTPANYMHLLRRQIKLPFRKPLIVMTPKALLHKAHSNFDDMLPGTSFTRLYKETGVASNQADQVKKILFCSGKVYYDLIDERKARNLDDQIAIARIEQIAPFPFDLVKEELCKYKNANICFVQEEHKNAGAYEFARARMQTILQSMNDPRVNHISYAGRDTAAATATGNKPTHYKELKKLLDDSMAV